MNNLHCSMRNENDFYLRLDRFSILLMESWTRLDSTVWKHPKQQTRISADFYHVCSGMGFSLCSWQFVWRKGRKSCDNTCEADAGLMGWKQGLPNLIISASCLEVSLSMKITCALSPVKGVSHSPLCEKQKNEAPEEASIILFPGLLLLNY